MVEYTFRIKVEVEPIDIQKIPDIKGYLEYIINKHFEVVSMDG